MANKNKKKNHINGDAVLENTNVANETEVLTANVEANAEQSKEEIKPSKKEKKANKKAVKKEKRQSKLVKKFKETGSELKKVTWPTFKQTMKKTGVVLGVVVLFGVILCAIDYILTIGLKALAGQSISTVEMWVSIGIACAIVLGVAVWLIVWAVRKKNRR